MARTKGSTFNTTSSQIFLLMQTDKFSREFDDYL